MNTTIESTATDDATLRLLLPTALAHRVLGYEDELQRLQAKPAQHAEAMRQVKVAEARAKDAAVEAAARMVLESRGDNLLKLCRKDRANFVKVCLENAPAKYGLPNDYADRARERDIRIIRAAIRDWEKINGCSYKSVQPG